MSNPAFADALTDALILHSLTIAGPLEAIAVNRAADRLRTNPGVMQGAIDDALAKCNLTLSSKGMNAMATASYISDPFPAAKTLIDSSASKTDRIHAALGVLDYGVVNYGPVLGLQASCEGATEAELCKAIEEACPCPKEGMAAIDWSKVWAVVQPLALQLLQRLLFSQS